MVVIISLLSGSCQGFFRNCVAKLFFDINFSYLERRHDKDNQYGKISMINLFISVLCSSDRAIPVMMGYGC